MSDATMLCTRCGFANGRGDQFCGSCGAFLEWEGQLDGATAAAADASPVDDTGLSGLVRPSAIAASTTAPPAPSAAAWTAPAAPPPARTSSLQPPTPPPDAGLLRCPACGIANAASRTFCQSCGTTLAATARVAGRSAEEIAAAVNAAPVARPVPTSAPTAAAGRSQPEQKKGGVAGWVVAVILVGIVAGVGFVAVSTLLKGNGPTSIASSAPSVPLPSASAAASSSTASSSPAAASSIPAAPGKPLTLIGAAASSVLGDQAQYQAQMAIDGNTSTSWQEGAATEKGQWIEVSFAPARVDAVVIHNGFDKSTALFKGNLRLKDVLISVGGGAPVAVRLKDTPNAQTIALTPVAGATNLRITIQTTYPSVPTSVAGTPFPDAAVSEISVIGAAGR